MSEANVPPDAPGLAELRAAWAGAGILAVLLHIPLTLPVFLANGVPWLTLGVLLTWKRTRSGLLDAWREAVTSRPGALGLVGLGLATVAVAILLSPAAGILLTLWLAAAASLVGLVGGPGLLREQLLGWSMLAIATGITLFALEGILHLRPVAARLGTPEELDAWWEQRYDRLWERNVLGIRSPYETLRKEPGVLRIVAIGDSFTWGDKIASPDSTWPAQLEGELRDRLPVPVEVVNLGELGYTMVNGAERLRRLGWQFEPDVVVVQFYLNDILPSGENFQQEFTEWLLPRAWILPERYRTGPVESSTLLWFIEGAISAGLHGDRADHAAAWTEVYRARGPEWAALEEAVREMGRAADERNVPIVFLLFPDFIPGAEDAPVLPFQEIHDQVTEVAVDAGFSILDLTPVYYADGGDPRRWWVTPYDEHPDEAAAKLAAEALTRHLLTTLDLPIADVTEGGGRPSR